MAERFDEGDRIVGGGFVVSRVLRFEARRRVFFEFSQSCRLLPGKIKDTLTVSVSFIYNEIQPLVRAGSL